MVQVLIVDDEYGIRTSLSGVLEDEGYETSAVESGEDCLQALAERQFDVVLLDIWLPESTGSKCWSGSGRWKIIPRSS